ncbi:MAG: site-2 protease family protein [Ignavibacteria bacterium]|nr:site-2 protease family protein [Ignavibacteria bacterium]
MDLKSYTENIYIIPILVFSVVIHEIAHGWVALRCGDSTAKDLGRITLNPVPHIDLLGSIIVPLFSIIATGRVFIAWAKPVPIDPRNFRHFKRDDNLVTLAGPISNLIIAFICVFGTAGMFYLLNNVNPAEGSFGYEFLNYLLKMFYAGVVLNVSLAVFNMLPIPPLDGSHVLANMLPDELAFRYRNIGFLGIFIILALFNFVPGFSGIFVSIITFVAKPYLDLINLLIK